MRTLIQNGTVVNATEQARADVLVEGEQIAAVGPSLSADRVDRRIDASGKLVLPGGVDVHTHLELPFGTSLSSDDFETGTRAAAFGGTTSIIDFATQPKAGRLLEGLAERKRAAEGKAVVDWGLHMVVRSVDETVLEELDELVRAGVTSFKVFTAYPGVYQLDDGAILRVLQRSAQLGALVMVHAENGAAIEVLIAQALARGETAPLHHALTRPARLEAEATARCLALAEVAKAALYVVHLSSREALEELVRARARGQRAWAETCPQYLFLSTRDLEKPFPQSAGAVFSPPVREPGNEEALWRGLQQGDLAVVATDHCPFNLVGQKDLGRESFTKIPNGLPGIETRLPLLWDAGVGAGRFDARRFVELTSAAPARLFGLYPRKGVVAAGSDADLVIWDPERELALDADKLHMRVDYSPYQGRRTRGAPEKVFSRGKLIVDGEKFLGRAGDGRFLARAPLPSREL